MLHTARSRGGERHRLGADHVRGVDVRLAAEMEFSPFTGRADFFCRAVYASGMDTVRFQLTYDVISGDWR